ncbi:9805_t:CDS:2 [Ambispora gerdemannii]|uniref:9805_t:CDS:1 n=1 Tax=Ambispora gerdemannii TaxID=144530 RepID=A0A9N9FER5_9GLOM|nr:9805_t:CDS:2 [Ambispora gerdemannii]
MEQSEKPLVPLFLNIRREWTLTHWEMYFLDWPYKETDNEENSVKNVHNRYTETQLEYLRKKKRITAYCKIPVIEDRVDYYTYKRDFKVNEEEDSEESEEEEESIKKASKTKRISNWVKAVSKSANIGNSSCPSPRTTSPPKGPNEVSMINSGNHSRNGSDSSLNKAALKHGPSEPCQLGSNWKLQRKQKIKQMRLKAMNKKSAEKALAILQGPNPVELDWIWKPLL